MFILSKTEFYRVHFRLDSDFSESVKWEPLGVDHTRKVTTNNSAIRFSAFVFPSKREFVMKIVPVSVELSTITISLAPFSHRIRLAPHPRPVIGKSEPRD